MAQISHQMLPFKVYLSLTCQPFFLLSDYKFNTVIMALKIIFSAKKRLFVIYKNIFYYLFLIYKNHRHQPYLSTFYEPPMKVILDKNKP